RQRATTTASDSKLRYDPPVAGEPSTSTYDPTPAPVKAKRAPRKKAAGDAATPPVEKRQARFKPSCPQNIRDRVDRVMAQRFFMVDRERVGDELKEEFKVLGSTGNIYTVTIQHVPSCDCPDARKGNHCKHIVLLQVPQSSGNWYQKALLTSELQEIFTNAPMAPNAVANPRVRAAYAEKVGKPLASQRSAFPGEEDDCPICYDAMHEVAEKKLVFCETCGNAVHSECFGQWQNTSRSQGKPLTCIYCRASWPAASAGAGAGAASGSRAGMREGYVNLANVAGVSPQRDTSSYYQGPRRGQPYYGGYGYGRYDEEEYYDDY
ncbi:hypothetical protein C8F01DRAFT_1120168, partial [Mycena amicta]